MMLFTNNDKKIKGVAQKSGTCKRDFSVSVPLNLVTVRNSSCGKVMFSQASVCPQGGGVHPLGRHPLPQADTPSHQADTPLWPDTTPNHETATSADGTHPTGMHSCSICSFTPDHSLQTMTWCTQKYRNDSRNLEATDIFILAKD